MTNRIITPLFFNESEYIKPTSCKEMKLNKINVHLAVKLNKEWHSRLPDIGWGNIVRNKNYVCYCAEHEGMIYAVAIWSTPVAANRLKNGNNLLELRRMAVADDAPKYTASWMIGKMIKRIKQDFKDIERLISYQDTEVHKGTIYKATNWKKENECDGMSWTTNNRKRNKEQTLAKKIRWGFAL